MPTDISSFMNSSILGFVVTRTPIGQASNSKSTTPYIEAEYKVLNVNPETVQSSLRQYGAQKVYDGLRTITYFDDPNGTFHKHGEGIKLTDEGKLKLEHSRRSPTTNQADSVKVVVSRKEETIALLARLHLFPISRVQARRISYELGSVDFDIDFFPGIPPFMEIDLGDSGKTLEALLEQLDLADSEVIVATTPEIFGRYGKDYFEEFKLATPEYPHIS